ncbi:hypothetical protein ACGFXC_10380 [Streptomyces sp. NPDC048507]|uniref:hypothetical protein n=1 Tax=Streptomyces sp. NPDC048507 TaxID=3365560 RepID=UPI0037240328
MFTVTLTRTGAQINAVAITAVNTAPSPSNAGNITDQTLGTLAAGWYDPGTVVVSSATNGIGAGGARLSSSGTMTLVSWLPSAAVEVSTAMSATFCFTVVDPDGLFSLSALSSLSAADDKSGPLSRGALARVPGDEIPGPPEATAPTPLEPS